MIAHSVFIRDENHAREMENFIRGVLSTVDDLEVYLNPWWSDDAGKTIYEIRFFVNRPLSHEERFALLHAPYQYESFTLMKD